VGSGSEMAELEDVVKRVCDAVAARSPGCENPRVLDINPRFLEGQLYTVAFEVDLAGTRETYNHKVYVVKGNLEVFGSDSTLIERIAGVKKKGFFESVHIVDVFSGVIALIMTITICALSAYGKQVPEILANGLSVILGFYFAKSISK
jgi:hypothetical protein